MKRSLRFLLIANACAMGAALSYNHHVLGLVIMFGLVSLNMGLQSAACIIAKV